MKDDTFRQMNNFRKESQNNLHMRQCVRFIQPELKDVPKYAVFIQFIASNSFSYSFIENLRILAYYPRLRIRKFVREALEWPRITQNMLK